MSATDTVIVITAIGGLVVTVGGQSLILLKQWQQGKAIKTTQDDVSTVKNLTNGNHQVLLARVDQLQNTISDAGGTIPASPKE